MKKINLKLWAFALITSVSMSFSVSASSGPVAADVLHDVYIDHKTGHVIDGKGKDLTGKIYEGAEPERPSSPSRFQRYKSTISNVVKAVGTLSDVSRGKDIEDRNIRIALAIGYGAIDILDVLQATKIGDVKEGEAPTKTDIAAFFLEVKAKSDHSGKPFIDVLKEEIAGNPPAEPGKERAFTKAVLKELIKIGRDMNMKSIAEQNAKQL